MKNLMLHLRFDELKQRIIDLEEKVFKTARKDTTTKSQQILLLKHLGILEKLNELNISNKKKAILLSALLNASADNIEKDLSSLYKEDSGLYSEVNYRFLTQIFDKAGLKKHLREAEIKLDEIQKNNDK